MTTRPSSLIVNNSGAFIFGPFKVWRNTKGIGLDREKEIIFVAYRDHDRVVFKMPFLTVTRAY